MVQLGQVLVVAGHGSQLAFEFVQLFQVGVSQDCVPLVDDLQVVEFLGDVVAQLSVSQGWFLEDRQVA